VIVSIARAQEMGYTLEDERKTWPPTQSLSEFARRSCRPLAKIIISDYFNLLWPRFLELKQRVNDIVLSAQHELEEVADELDEYIKSQASRDDFLR